MIFCKQEKTSQYQSKQGDLKFKGHMIVRSYDLHAFQTYWDDSVRMCIAHFFLLNVHNTSKYTEFYNGGVTWTI